ncbi:MAG TPA: hypothetical protein VNU26_12800 [Mycobacteriales bacterium]|nr:hypothetical protein [Mycobacteriales bacterium]
MHRRTTPLLAAAALLVAATGTVTVLTADGADDGDVLAVAPPAAHASAGDRPNLLAADRERRIAPSPTPAAAKAPAPVAAATTEAPAPPRTAAPQKKVPAPATSDPESAPDDGSGYGYTPGVVVHPFDPGRTSHSVTRDGVTLTVRFSTVTPKTGQSVILTLDGAGGSGCCSLHALYGDGIGDDQQVPADNPCTSTSSQGSFTHAWNTPGRYLLQLQASRHGCSHGEAYPVMRVTVDVAPGAPPVSNGPSAPVAAFDIAAYPPANDRGLVSWWGQGEDRDGHVTHFVLDPGDGTAPKRIPGANTGPCQQTKGGYAAGSMAWLPNDPPPQHRYAKPGSYTATLKVYSYGCDGKHEQVASATYTYSW